ncbi:hypothetical protein Tco_1005212 [Tanacetum coccineum]|uniref:Uncharacterized protein n=1 Tax=Tanacetum coccineum TaxID=301880 RepID=A0ABQ5FET8_9ASTR
MLIPDPTNIKDINEATSTWFQDFRYSDTTLPLLEVSKMFKVKVFLTVMSSASSAVTYTSVYTDSEQGRVFWGADEEEEERRGSNVEDFSITKARRGEEESNDEKKRQSQAEGSKKSNKGLKQEEESKGKMG